jgi:hypothetical protein
VNRRPARRDLRALPGSPDGVHGLDSTPMKRVALAAAVAVLSYVLIALAPGGCTSDSCTKDTDCELPFICVQAACVPLATTDAPGPDADADADADGDADADADGDDDGADADEGGADEATVDGDGGCSTVGTPFAVEPATGTPDTAERPVVLRNDAAFVYFGRSRGVDPADCLHFQRIGLDGRPSASAACATSGIVATGAVVPLSLSAGFATAYAVSTGTTPGVWVKLVPSSGTGGVAAVQVPGTNASSGQPTIAFDGSGLVVAWIQTLGGGSVELRAVLADSATGEATGTPVVLATGPAGTGEPRLFWGETRYALAWFDASDGALHVSSLDRTLVSLAQNILRPASGESFVGAPALTWNGTVFGLAWITRAAGGATMHLATFRPGETPLDHRPLATLVPLSGMEPGQVALAWNELGLEWGLAWRRTLTSRASIALVRVDGEDFSLLDGPVDLSPGSVAPFHPALDANGGVYLAAWVEDPTFLAAYGCSP